MHEKPNKPAPVKKEWAKPEVRVIVLTAEEVLAVGCKTRQLGNNVLHKFCGIAQGCNQEGS
jgi:hypothetical protein